MRLFKGNKERPGPKLLAQVTVSSTTASNKVTFHGLVKRWKSHQDGTLSIILGLITGGSSNRIQNLQFLSHIL